MSFHDCRVIRGSRAVVITRDTAQMALECMQKVSEQGGFKHLRADDASFVSAAMQELEAAVALDPVPFDDDPVQTSDALGENHGEG